MIWAFEIGNCDRESGTFGFGISNFWVRGIGGLGELTQRGGVLNFGFIVVTLSGYSGGGSSMVMEASTFSICHCFRAYGRYKQSIFVEFDSIVVGISIFNFIDASHPQNHGQFSAIFNRLISHVYRLCSYCCNGPSTGVHS